MSKRNTRVVNYIYYYKKTIPENMLTTLLLVDLTNRSAKSAKYFSSH